jgi:S1-C subfamily serine protease
MAEADPKPGDTIYALGANAAGELALTEGTVKRLVPDSRGPLLEISMPVAPNGSGGPVFDGFGKVVGIATTAQGHGAAVSLAIPVSWLARMQSRERAPS